jgi:hypothetical protein
MRRSFLIAVPVAAALAVSFAAAPAFAAGASYTWIGGAFSSGGDNHSWSDPKNWSPSGVPGTGDSVSIDSPDDSHCSVGVLDIPTVTLANLSVSQNPTRCGVSITGAASAALTVTGSFSWNGGGISIPITLDAGSSGTITGANGRLNGLNADLSVDGSLTLSGLVADNGTNTGSLRITAGDLLHIAPGGTLTSSGANFISFTSCCNIPAKVVNDGTLEVDGGDLTVTAVEVDQNGTLSAANGGRLVSDGAPLTAGNGASYTGSGGWLIKNKAKAKLAGTQTLGGNFHLELGGLDVDAGADLGGTATFAGTGTIDWTGGAVEGNFTVGHGVHLVASGVHTGNGRRILSGQDALSNGVASTVTNHGMMTFSADATVGTGGRAKLVNAADGTINIAPGVVFASGGCCLNPDELVNNGTVNVPSAATNAAPAELDAIAYKSTGTTSVAAGQQLLLADHAPGLLSGSAVTGSGTLAVATPMTVSGTNSVGAHAHLLLELGGSLNGTSTFNGAGSLAWTGGAISGAVTVAVGGGTAISGTDQKTIANVNGGTQPSKLTFKSHVSVAAGTSAHHDPIIVGTSTLALDSSTTVGNFADVWGGKLINAGTLTVRPGTLERDGSASTVNQGTVSLAAGATFQSNGTYSQTTHGTLAVHLGAHGHGLLSVQRSVALPGKLTAQDDGSYNPGIGKKVRIVASSDVTASPTCVTTSGAGSANRHWVAGKNATGLVLTRQPGAHRTC